MAAKWTFSSSFVAEPFNSAIPTMESDILTTTADCSGSENEDEDEDGFPLSKMTMQFRNYWNAATENPYCFNAWTKLIAFAESERNLAGCRKAYNAFLELYPLCHIYWKKFVDLEQHLGNTKNAEKIFDRALKTQSCNVSLWLSYIQYLNKNMDSTSQECVEKLRGVFQEAVKACGLDFNSDELWQLFIEFEIKQGNLKDAASLFDRVLCIPSQNYLIHYERFKQFATTYSPLEFLSNEEREWVFSRIQDEGDENQVATEDTDEILEFLTDSDQAKIRAQIIKVREQLYLLNKAEVTKRLPFEDQIKRCYFYAAPLNIKQLRNWKKYLQFEVSEGRYDRIVMLYERCLMSCAFYDEFWLSYVKYIESHSVETARSIFERACRITFPIKYNLRLQWAEFEEKHGCLEAARSILCQIETALPGLAILRLKRVALERRSGNLQEAEKLLEEARKSSVDVQLASFYAVKLSRLIFTLQGDPDKAKAVLTNAIERDPDNPKLHLCLLEIELSKEDPGDAALHCVEEALKRDLPEPAKAILSRRRLEILEDFSSSLTSWVDAYNEHQTIFERQSLKRDDPQELINQGIIQEELPPPSSTNETSNQAFVSPSDSSASTSASTQGSNITQKKSSYSSAQRAAYSNYGAAPNASAMTFSGSQHSYSFGFQGTPGPVYNLSHFSRPPIFNSLPYSGNFNNPPRFNMHPYMGNQQISYRMNVPFNFGSWYQNFPGPLWNRFFPPH